MEGAGWRAELDISFRQNILNNVIMKELKGCSKNSQDPNVLRKIYDIVIKFEQHIFEKATSKDDYVAKIHQRLNQAKGKFDGVMTPTTGNQSTIPMIQKQVNHPYHGQQNFDGTFLPLDKQNMLPNQLHSYQNPMVTSMQQREIGLQPSLNGFHQDWQIGYQNAPIQNDPYGKQHMFNMDNCQRSVGILNQVGNSLASQMPRMGSSSQLLQSMPYSQGIRNQFQGFDMSSIPQSQMAAIKAPGAFAYFRDSEGVNTVDWEVLITQFQRMKSAYLPELMKLLEKVEIQCKDSQSIERFQKFQKTKVVLGRMISFLQMKEREIMAHSKEKLICYINQITKFIRPTVKSTNTKSTGNQALQFSSSHHPQMNMQNLLYQTPRGTADHSKQNPQPVDSSSVNQVYLEMMLSGTSQYSTQKKDDHSILNPNCGVFQHNFSRTQFSRNPPEAEGGDNLHMKASQHSSSSIPFDQEKDTSFLSNLGGSSLLKTSAFTLDSPSTPMTPSSVPKDIEKPVLSVFRSSGEAKTNQCETEIKAEASLTLEISPESTNELPLAEKKPIERLIEAVEGMSQEAFSSSVHDIASVVSTLDRIADVDLANFLIDASQTVESNIIDEHRPVKVKRDINSIHRVLDNNSNYLFSCAAESCLKRLKIEPKHKHDLLLEMRKINQKLVETIVELCPDDDPKQGTIVRCTYNPVVLSETFKRQFAPATLVSPLSVDLLVPSDYPNSPPRCLDRMPKEFRKDDMDLREKAKSRFNRCIRGLEQPNMSVGEMARAWDDCARSVISEFAFCVGGESFSSKYGSWECLPAAS